MKIVLYTKGPASWPLRGTAVKVFFFEFFSHRSAAQQALFWGGANNRTRGVEGQQSRMLSEYYDFHRKNSFHSFIFSSVFHGYRIAGDATATGAHAKIQKKCYENVFLSITPDPIFNLRSL